MGVAGSSRQCFSLRACFQNQKLISKGLRKAHSLMPNPRESTFSPSFITRFHFPHNQDLLITSSSCTEQWQLVSELGCFWCKKEEPKCTYRRTQGKYWTASVLWLNCTPHQDYSDGKRCPILEVWKLGLGTENGRTRGAAVTSTLLQGEKCAGKGWFQTTRHCAREQIRPSKHRFYSCNIPH